MIIIIVRLGYIHIVFNLKFLREGNIIFDAREPERIVTRIEDEFSRNCYLMERK